MQGALTAIRVAREEGIPCLGTCGGFQHMIIEYARNVLAFHDACHEEYDPYASRLFVSRLACSLVGRSLPLRFTAGSIVASIYNSTAATESYYCNFGVNPDLVELFRQGPLRITGSDPEGEVRSLNFLTTHSLSGRCSCRRLAVPNPALIRWFVNSFGRRANNCPWRGRS